jgi:hypothetical protein
MSKTGFLLKVKVNTNITSPSKWNTDFCGSMWKAFSVLFFTFLLFISKGKCQNLEDRVTTQCNIGMTINNLGLIGNAFRGSYNQKKYSSCQYPAGSNIEHLFQGGLWVGAVKTSRRKTLNPDTSAGAPDSILVKTQTVPYVSTAAFDSPVGYSAGSSNFEFTALSPGITERSSLPQSTNYRTDAVSHQDLITEFTDRNFSIPGSGNPPKLIPGHTNSLGLDVKLETYNWNFSFANFFVILNYNIKNVGVDTLDSLHVGQYYNAVVRNVSRTLPSGTAFFNKGGNGYIDSLRMGYVFDATGDPGFTESYVGIKFLGAEKVVPNGQGKVFIPGNKVDSPVKVNFYTWLYGGTAEALLYPPPNDPTRFERMSKGLQFEPTWSEAPIGEPIRENLKKPNNRINVLSCGNLKTLLPGETISVVFVAVCAKKDNSEGLDNKADTEVQRRNLFANAFWAQTAYNGEDANADGSLSPEEDFKKNGKIDRYILPNPPDVPQTKVIASNNKVDVYWSKNAENSIDPISKEKDFEGYKLYKSSLGFDVKASIDLENSYELVGEWDKNDNLIGFNSGFKSIKLEKDTTFSDEPNTTYSYRFSFPTLQNGWQHAISVTAFDQGSAKYNLGPLETSLRSNQFFVFPGTDTTEDVEKNKPFVYPDPYYAGASWEGSSTRPEDGKLYFANLPALCEVRIFSSAGDLIDEFTHNSSTYQGSESWFKTYSSFSQDPAIPDKRVFSGGEHDWNLLSKDSQIISRGLYLFSVKDLKSGNIQTGKFTIIK